MQKEDKKNSKKKYRLVILNERTFEERISLTLTKLNVYIFSTIVILLVGSGVYFLIAFTPLKQYVIPGYTNVNYKKELSKITSYYDSLETDINYHQEYLKNLTSILSGMDEKTIDSLSKPQNLETNGELNFGFTKEDSMLMASLSGGKGSVIDDNPVYSFLRNLNFSKPCEGVISQNYKAGGKQKGIKIKVADGTSIRSVLDGFVVNTELSLNNANTIIIQHQNNLISVYKFNSRILKNNGTFVEGGETIAISGTANSPIKGEVIFELWYNGIPLNPQDFIKM